MTRRPLVILTLATVGIMAAISAWAWGQLPDDALIPVHWGIDGEIDGYAPKAVALTMLPLAALLLGGLFLVLPAIEPRRTNFESSMKLYATIWVGVLALFVAIHVATVAIALGNDVAMDRIVIGAIGALFVAIGNFLPKTRSTFLMGIRTPWTLTSEASWARTHRVGGYGFVLLGVAALALALLDSPGVASLLVVGGGVIALVVILVVVSYVAWRADPERTTLDGVRG